MAATRPTTTVNPITDIGRPSRVNDHAGRAVDRRGVHLVEGVGEHPRRVGDRGGAGGGARHAASAGREVGVKDHVAVQDGDERVEVASTAGGEEHVDDVPLGGRARRPGPARRPGRVVARDWRAAGRRRASGRP